LLPRAQKANLPGFSLSGPFGEIVANSYAPALKVAES
jgi:alkanesulfonate monooxygenase